MDTVWRKRDGIGPDVRYGLRVLRKNPGFTAMAVLTLAFSIGSNTVTFSLINSLMLRPLPVDQPDELLALNNTAANRSFPTFSYPNYRDLRDRSQSFSGLIAYRFAPLSLSRDGVNERLWGYLVTGSYFPVLGVKAARGRVLSEEDDRVRGAHPVAVISFKCWRSRFGGAEDVVGKSVVANGGRYTIVGVAAQGFDGTEKIAAPEIWFPMAMQAQIDVGRDWLDDRAVEQIFVQGRLRPGLSREKAQGELNAIAAQLEAEYPDVNEAKHVALSPPGLVGRTLRGPVFGFVGVLMLAVSLVLLLACTNLANLLLARAADRRSEIAVRLALGASRIRLVRQLLTESVLLAALGGIAGTILAAWLVGLSTSLRLPVDFPLALELRMDYRVLGFAVLVSLSTAVLFGLVPALQATRADLVPALRESLALGGRRRPLLARGLIVLQVALSFILLIGGGLMFRALQKAETIELGFDPERAVEASMDLRLQGYGEAQGREFQKRLLDRLRALPEVRAAGITDLVPVDLHFPRSGVFAEGQPPVRAAAAPSALTSLVSPGYLQAIDTRLLQGRDFTDHDDATAPPVAIVNQTFARRFWPGEDAIGRRFSLGREDAPKLQVIGIVRDGKYTSLAEDPKPFVYRALFQTYSGTTSVVVRADGDPQRMLPAVRSVLRELDPQLPLASARTLAERLGGALLPARLGAAVLGSFGVLALALAAIGIYGVTSYAVSWRMREIGVRMALGAEKGDVLRLVVGGGVALTLVGAAIGTAAALFLTRLMRRFLFGVSSADELTYAAVGVLLVGVAFLACYLPARRAARTDPVLALRSE